MSIIAPSLAVTGEKEEVTGFSSYRLTCFSPAASRSAKMSWKRLQKTYPILLKLAERIPLR